MNDSFVSVRTLARWTAGLLIAQAVIGLASLLTDLSQAALIRTAIAGRGVSIAQAVAGEAVAQVINLFEAPLLLATALLFLLWIFRAHRNLSALGAARLEHTPGWAVGGFFVPILNLFVPFQVMREIWKASDPTIPPGNPNAWWMMDSTPALGWWWACWLMYNFSLSIGQTMTKLARTPLALLKALYWDSAAQLIGLIGLVLISWLVLTIDRRQEELHQRVLQSQWQWPVVQS